MPSPSPADAAPRKRTDLLKTFIILTMVLQILFFFPYLLALGFRSDILGIALLDRFVLVTGIFGLLAAGLGFFLEQRTVKKYNLYVLCLALSAVMVTLAVVTQY